MHKAATKETSPDRIAKLTVADFPRVMQIERAAFPNGRRKTVDGYRSCIVDGKKHGNVYVVWRADTIVGYLHVKHEAMPKVLLCNLATDPAHEGMGIGTFAINWLRKKSAGNKSSLIFLHVRASKPDTIAWYKHRGFTEIKRGPCGYKVGSGDELTKVTMELDLSAPMR